ncbi:hypothetical protein FSARC_3447 [Fusarium sarcochroum]|uniref:Uncharacterized protein n=1 Tax=Fusarium sarcochroum TaxID=1208366 RepID=A0A8H4U415_9HYPO|nr:hypothetical protein FSARC_3447 [Fusarium sarcochroum]
MPTLSEAEIRALQQEVQALRADNRDLRSDNQELRIESQSLRNENQSLRTENEALRSKLTQQSTDAEASSADGVFVPSCDELSDCDINDPELIAKLSNSSASQHGADKDAPSTFGAFSSFHDPRTDLPFPRDP